MRRISSKMARIVRKIRAVRNQFRQDFPLCWRCGISGTDHIHEIARGANRRKAVQEPCCWLALCAACHREIHAKIDLVAEYAICKAFNPAYNRVRINTLRGRAEDAVSESDVASADQSRYPPRRKESKDASFNSEARRIDKDWRRYQDNSAPIAGQEGEDWD